MSTLDNPVWFSLRSGHAHLSRSGGSALRYATEVAPFAAVEREGDPVPESLLAPDESTCFVGVLPRACADWRVEEQAHVLQLTCARAAPVDGPATAWRALGEQDVLAMLDLTARVFPGYFREHTLAMGTYLGIFADDGRLVAMAGERMNLGDRCEISAVCTDPSRAGRGHARQLVHALVTAALQRGAMSFLHVSPENTRARHVYAALGFEPRATLRLLRVRRGP